MMPVKGYYLQFFIGECARARLPVAVTALEIVIHFGSPIASDGNTPQAVLSYFVGLEKPVFSPLFLAPTSPRAAGPPVAALSTSQPVHRFHCLREEQQAIHLVPVKPYQSSASRSPPSPCKRSTGRHHSSPTFDYSLGFIGP